MKILNLDVVFWFGRWNTSGFFTFFKMYIVILLTAASWQTGGDEFEEGSHQGKTEAKAGKSQIREK